MSRVLIIFSFMVLSCHYQAKPPIKKASISWDSTGHASISDSSGMVMQFPCQSYDSLLSVISANKREGDSLTMKLFLAQFKVARVQRYIGIVDHDPTQLKFLKGWIKRAIQ